MDKAIQKRCEDLDLAVARLAKLSSRDASVNLRCSLSAPKLLYTFRTSPCAGHPLLDRFDMSLREGLSLITNNKLTDFNWLQASLPIRDGGLGIRIVAVLAPSAFLASAAFTQALQNMISPNLGPDVCVDANVSLWLERYGASIPSVSSFQRHWDRPAVSQALEIFRTNCRDDIDRARLLAVCSNHASDWLYALQISSCGLRLDNEATRVAVGLRLGLDLCAPHICPCGALVDSKGIHALSCRKCAGKMSRHQELNDVVWRPFTSAQIPAVKEPIEMCRSDGKRLDGTSLIPWSMGHNIVWDVTVADTVVQTYIQHTCVNQESAAELLESRKRLKYAELTNFHLFVPIALEFLGPICEETIIFISELGRRLTAHSADTRETAYLFQRISTIVQRSNAISFRGCFPLAPEVST